MKNLVFATGNQHKADHLSRLLGFPILHQRVEIKEIQALDIAEVGEYKAREAFKHIQKPVFVDDFGTYLKP